MKNNSSKPSSLNLASKIADMIDKHHQAPDADEAMEHAEHPAEQSQDMCPNCGHQLHPKKPSFHK